MWSVKLCFSTMASTPSVDCFAGFHGLFKATLSNTWQCSHTLMDHQHPANQEAYLFAR